MGSTVLPLRTGGGVVGTLLPQAFDFVFECGCASPVFGSVDPNSPKRCGTRVDVRKEIGLSENALLESMEEAPAKKRRVDAVEIGIVMVLNVYTVYICINVC
jgi:hypothetical protein